jgi:Winged helix DNA-binding domain
LSETRNWTNYFAYYGISRSQYEAYLAAAPQVLGSEPMTREQFATAVIKHTGAPDLHSLVLSKGWGTPLKPLAWRGDLCFGPNQGRNVTFVHPGKWIGKWLSVEPYTALQEMARRYLRAYGPARPEDFARWWEGGSGIVPARKLFQSLADELEAVDVEGWRAFTLRETLEPMQRLELSGSVNLLPLFDAYVLGLGRGPDIEPLLSKPYQSQVFRPQGWISAVVLVDGYMRGVWDYTNRGSQTIVKLRMFASPTALVWRGIEAESERLGAFLNTKVVLAYE